MMTHGHMREAPQKTRQKSLCDTAESLSSVFTVEDFNTQQPPETPFFVREKQTNATITTDRQKQAA